MRSSSKDLAAARTAWKAIPAQLRAEVAETLVPEASEEQLRERLATSLLDGPLASDLPRHGASRNSKQGLRDLVDRAISPLFEPPADGAEPAFARAYAQELLALSLPLVDAEPPYEASLLCDLLERTHGHEVLAPLAEAAAVERLADELWRVAGDELKAKAGRVVGSTGTGGEMRWVDRPDRLLLSVDHVTLSCARYLAGLEAPDRDRYGYDELRAGPAGRAKHIDKVTVRFEPDSSMLIETGEANAEPAGSELKAKLFVALFALAAQTKSRGEPSHTRVRLRDLLGLMGFELGRVTNSAYYWRYASQLTRYLLIDLPSRVVAMQLTLAGESGPRVVFEPLLETARPLEANGEALSVESLKLLYGALQQAPEESDGVVRRLSVEGFEFAVSDELLAAHGIGRPLNAIEHVPVEVLSLRGPAFWLAWQVAFLRRWARLPANGAQGKPLLRALQEAGHLAACTRAGRVRYREALSNWWRDSGQLAAIGLLDEPGVRLYGRRGGSWREISNEVSRWLDPGGGRVSRNRLQEIRVVYQIPGARIAQLHEARGRHRKRSSGSSRVGSR